MKRALANNLSFMNFLGIPVTIPDSLTIWLFKVRQNLEGKLESIWQELQRLLDAKGLGVKEGYIQGATFSKSDPGRSGNNLRGKENRNRRSKDGTWDNKRDEFFFGVKLHDKVDIDGLIRSIEVTAAFYS